jgi:hypothetical protein
LKIKQLRSFQGLLFLQARERGKETENAWKRPQMTKILPYNCPNFFSWRTPISPEFQLGKPLFLSPFLCSTPPSSRDRPD